MNARSYGTASVAKYPHRILFAMVSESAMYELQLGLVIVVSLLSVLYWSSAVLLHCYWSLSCLSLDHRNEFQKPMHSSVDDNFFDELYKR